MNTNYAELDSLDCLEGVESCAWAFFDDPGGGRELSLFEEIGVWFVIGIVLIAYLPMLIFWTICETVPSLTTRQTLAHWLGLRPRPAWESYCRSQENIRASEEWLANWKVEVETHNERQRHIGNYEI